ncbi:putative endo-xylogalacturonan hydrolase A [Pestalotiopsis fici W106-1]|uniref:Putative endo-xylogalacturonan hydrolase A n=1 Tax=Pestalotiopsis fici (strain W106-1 / CGMCC3.15140) TaxID=1229662 RepID=W3XEX7_PESFW|nr:putative endo-xylogalacturonan hydrolase A [Pestalotiopsis fici W106-1]ETS84574.1 putative endo-xylogalacturonan hydrolase A [Pestalotiopsis fici W106-1]
MLLHWLSFACVTAVITASAIPARDPPTRVIHERAETCTPKAGGSASTDDVPALQSAITSCPSGTILIPASTTYHVNSVFDVKGCSGCTIQLEGTLQMASSTDTWNGQDAQILVDDITGLNIVSSSGSGVIDGNGQASWDRFAEDSSYDRPTMLYIAGSSSDVVVRNVKMTNAPNVFVSATSGTSKIQLSSLALSAVSTSDNLPKNTDGFDISGSYVTLDDISIVNDDDCIAFKPGANYVTATDITCTGGHGISVGSLGSKSGATDTVSNVYVDGVTMVDTTKAAGIKLYPGGTAHGTAVVRNVTFANFVVDGADYAFQVQSCYNEDADYCAASPSTATLTDIVVSGFSGTTSDKYEPTVANIDCPADGTCDITMSGMTVKAPSGTGRYLCANTPSNLGVTCTSGASG